MQDHELDDLIIDNINPKNSKTKSFLTIIALAIVVLIIAIILTRIILKDPNNDLLLEENNTQLFSPDLTLQGMPEETVKKPLIPTIDEKTSKPVEFTQKDEHLRQSEHKLEKKLIELKQDKEQQTKETLAKEKLAKEKLAKEKLALEKLALEKSEKEKLTQERLALEKLALEKSKKEKLLLAQQQEAEAKQAVNNDILNPYYIQVGSFSKTPSKRFLNVIQNSGFKYTITAPSARGIKKLLIGPYSTKTEVNNALIRVKDRINKTAYIIRK